MRAFIKVLNKVNIYRMVFVFVVSVSFSFFAMQQIVVGEFTDVRLILTGILSFFIAAVVLYYEADHICEYIKQSPMHLLFSIVFGVCIAVTSYTNKGNVYYQEGFGLPVNVFRVRYYVLASLSLIICITLAIRSIINFMADLYAEMTNRMKWMYCILSIVISMVIVVLYSTNPMWYRMFDHVYGLDSEWCYEIIYADINYYDIRHPLMGSLTYPIYSILSSLISLIAPSNLHSTLLAISIQMLHAQCLLLIGLMIWVMNKKRMETFIIYMSSFPTLLFSLSFEKYQISIFLVVLYIYLYLKRRRRSIIGSAVIGTMPTDGVICFIELFGESSVKEKTKKVINLALALIAICILTGRIFLLNIPRTFKNLMVMHSNYSQRPFTFVQRCYAFFNMIKGSFIGITSIESNTYTWDDVFSKPDIVTILIFAIILIGLAFLWSEDFTRICALELFASFVLIVALNWAPQEAPLFSIFFSWAYIVLFCNGIRSIMQILNAHKIVCVLIIATIIIIINISMMISISTFLKTRHPEEVVLPKIEAVNLILSYE